MLMTIMASHPREPCNQALVASTVELSISCQDLPNCDVVTKSDPQVVVYFLDGSEWKELDRTERIQGNLNPEFIRKIRMKYHFDQIQRLRFEVWDIDQVVANDYLGGLETTLGRIMGSRRSIFRQPLVNGPKRSRTAYLMVAGQEVSSSTELISMKVKIRCKLASLSWYTCGIRMPASHKLLVQRTHWGGLSYSTVYESAMSRRNEPQFEFAHMSVVKLSNGDPGAPIKFQLINCRNKRSLGSFRASIDQLSQASADQAFTLKRSNGQTTKVRGYQLQAVVVDFQFIQPMSFLGCIKAGVRLHFMLVVDMSASNGDPNHPYSLHYIDPTGRRLNPYEQAMLAVGQVIEPYDSQHLFSGFGFGAQLPGCHQKPNYLFALNSNEQHPYVCSTEQLLAAYRNKIAQVSPSHPTRFAPCIAHCASIAKKYELSLRDYFVLLVLTDGLVTDTLETKRAIREATQTPMSIVFCGVGEANLSSLVEQDFEFILSASNSMARRDIVHYVLMNQHSPGQAKQRDQAEMRGSLVSLAFAQQPALARELLREVPFQLTSYMDLVKAKFRAELDSNNNKDPEEDARPGAAYLERVRNSITQFILDL